MTTGTALAGVATGAAGAGITGTGATADIGTGAGWVVVVTTRGAHSTGRWATRLRFTGALAATNFLAFVACTTAGLGESAT